jgi:hypothetical protein
MKVPPPATALMAPATNPATKSMRAERSVIFPEERDGLAGVAPTV